MCKKLLLVILIMLPICAWGWACGRPCCWNVWGNGFYAGAGVGVDATEFRTTSYVSKPSTFDVINKTQSSAQGVLGNIFAGYSWRYCWLYLAGELNGNLSSARFHTTNQEFFNNAVAGTTYKINRTWGVSALPGIILPQTTLLYGRIGYVNGFFNTDTTDVSLANVSARLNGVRYGLGLQKRICRNFDMRFEYSRISYQDHSDFVFDPIGTVSKKTILTPFSNQFELGFVYHFC